MHFKLNGVMGIAKLMDNSSDRLLVWLMAVSHARLTRFEIRRYI
ncbi:MAG TPA: hypothetical protein V6D25_13415 [Leptolyngbyaceae cyanobacterium]